jgi:Cytochrome P460
MKWIALILVVVVAVVCVVGAQAPTAQPADEAADSIAAGKLPSGYRDWRLISVARETGELDDIRAVLGNDAAIKAYRAGAQPFPEGTIIARIAWAYLPSDENNKTFGKAQSFVAGNAKNGVQFMVKDSAKYASTGGWGILSSMTGNR